jgi:hypothetical protein
VSCALVASACHVFKACNSRWTAEVTRWGNYTWGPCIVANNTLRIVFPPTANEIATLKSSETEEAVRIVSVSATVVPAR